MYVMIYPVLLSSDDLVKVDQSIESLVKRVERQYQVKLVSPPLPCMMPALLKPELPAWPENFQR